ncbi:hypothetical protein [Pedobacter puniceum]|uniref:Lipoprotein n=1 Tax=Pedobacter puniceum TaxID=2666136 RepID=A0A7K0FML3_9SPHI|nr:hypothetical protein [Pedobacter puniceum]MRX46911.1 hypothetical protein [Pedobacter puniceum]
MKAIKLNMIILALSFILPFQSCEKSTENKGICGVEDPLNNLSWLNKEFKSLIGGPEMNGIVLYEYNEQQIIEIQSSEFSSTNQHQYYCDGTKLNLDDSIEYSDFMRNRKEIKIIYGSKIWR